MSDYISSPNFYYNKQLRNYLIQFMAAFAGLQVQVGWTDDKEPRLINVPVYSASKDRVVAAIKTENTQNKPIRLPCMSSYLQSIDLDPSLRKGITTYRSQTYMPTGGLFPDDFRVVTQRMPVPYKGTYELGIWTSNQEQHNQIIEQILMLFNPTLQIQTSDEPFDWTKITQIEMTGIQMNENVPAGGERRIIQTVITFTIPMWISIPVDVHQRFVKEIYFRIGAVSEIAQNSYDIVAELDQQGLEYELDFSLDDVVIDETS